MFRDPMGRIIDQNTRNPNFEMPDINEVEINKTYSKNVLNNMERIKSASTSISALPQHISNITSLKMKPEYIIMHPFYSDEYLLRCSNAYLFDDVINSAIERLAYFTLGTSDEWRTVLYPESIRPLKSEVEAKSAIKALKIIKSGVDTAGAIINQHLSDQEITDFETMVHYTDKNARLGRFIRNNYRGVHVFARSASYIEYSSEKIPSLGLPAGCPIGLKPLKPMLLGSVAIDPDSWEIKAVEYRDEKVKFKEYTDPTIKAQQADQFSTGEQKNKFLSADNLLYFVRGNNNMMRDEDDYWFGHSTLQSIMPLSEESRRLKQIVWPQINQSQWAGSAIWFFPNWTKDMMDSFFRTLKPGGHAGVPINDIKVQELKLQVDYAGLINLQNELKKGILTAFGLPSFLMNFEDVTNRATAETVVIGFNESTIQSERSWLSDILDEQWYSKLFKIYWPDDKYIHVKLKMQKEFENITFENFLEKAVAAVTLFEKKMMTMTEIRNMLKLPPLQPKDYEELGLTNPATRGNLVDPAVQPVPGTPNLVGQLVAQNELKQAAIKQQKAIAA